MPKFWGGSMKSTISAILLSVLLSACGSSLALRNGVPDNLVGKAIVPGMPENIRFWGDESPNQLKVIAQEKISQMRKRFQYTGRPKAINYLAISGGGEDGAFGAGLLVGWTKAGNRPDFEIVTGISTGSLIAPFAFLGPAWDKKLQDAYLSISADQVFSAKILRGLLGGLAITDNKPLAGKIASFVDEAMLKAVAQRHQTGRRLLIGTTNLDEQRPVIWDMGKIASSGRPEALALFRRILLASTAIPGVFPPTIFKVKAGGISLDELHVDGGVTTQVFLFPTQINPGPVDRQFGFKPKRRIYVIRNARVNPEREVVRGGLLKISSRSLSTVIKAQGVGDMIRIYTRARKSKMDYNLAYIPAKLGLKAKKPFDQKYMKALFAVGFELGKNGYAWKKAPPGIL